MKAAQRGSTPPPGAHLANLSVRRSADLIGRPAGWGIVALWSSASTNDLSLGLPFISQKSRMVLPLHMQRTRWLLTSAHHALGSLID